MKPDQRAMRRRRWPWWVLGGLLVLAALTITPSWWAITTESGTLWLLRWVPGLAIDSPRGSLLSGSFAAQRVVWTGADGLRVEVEKLAWQGLRVEHRPAAALSARVTLAELAAERVTVEPGKSSASPPASLRAPIALRVTQLRIGELRLAGADDTPLRNVRASVHLGADGGDQHRVDDLAFVRERIDARAALQIGADAPLASQVSIELQGVADAAGAWQASMRARGPLARMQLDGQLRAAAGAADVTATLRPFEPWPLPTLDATARGLDLARIVEGAPMTAIDGQVRIEGDGWSRPARVAVDLRNAQPGRFNAGRLPVERLRIDGAARPDRPEQFEAKALSVVFANDGGRFEGRARLDRDTIDFDGRLSALRSERLDARLAALLLDGSVSGNIAALGTAPTLELKAQLVGRAGASRAVDVKLDLTAQRDRLDVRSASARAGDASARLSGRLQRASDRSWQVVARGHLERFDPLLFWGGRDDSPWRRGPHRVNAAVEADLRATAPARASVSAWLAALRGEARVKIGDSVLAGVPLSGDIALSGRDAGLQLHASAAASGNRTRVDALLVPSGADRWQATIEAPALAALDPVVRLLRPTAGAAPAITGALDAQLSANGRWPTLVSDGRATLTNARFGNVGVARASGRWHIDSARGAVRDAAVDLQLDAAGVQLGRDRSLTTASLRIDGTLAAHRIEASATSPLRPPAWVDDVAGVPAGRSSVARASASGGASAALDGWRGVVSTLTLGADGADAKAQWLQSRDLSLTVALDPRSHAPAALAVEPGRAEVLGTTLRWSQLAWRADSGRVDVQAELDRVPVVPWLRRLQPEFGWGGDLTLGGRIKVSSAPTFSADIVIERRGGDLTVADASLPDLPPQRAGLTDLRLALAANDGLWHFTQALAGDYIGIAVGAQSLRVAPNAAWPAASTPLEGVLQVRVAHLGAWGNWWPASWRLSGALEATAQLGGRFGAPEYTGRIVGREIGVRNVLQGVNVSDGEFAIALQGPTARIEHAHAHAGGGSVSVEGDASLAARPRAQLRLVAERFQLLGRVDRRIVASGSAALQLDGDAVKLDGRFGVDEGMVDFSRDDAPALGDDVEVLRAGRAGGAEYTPPSRARPVAIDLRVDLGRNLRLRGRGLDTKLGGELRLTTPGGRLAVNGDVRADEGKYVAYGQKLDIERGVLSFNGPAENPRLDILALRPNLDVRVGVAVTGPALQPRVRLISEPEMSDADKLSWLMLGRASSGLGRADTALLQRAALALLAGEGGESKVDSVTRTIGLDEMSMRQTDDDVRETVVTLGKQLGRRWYVGYERSLNATAGTWQLIYRIAQRVTVRAQSGIDNSLDVIWTWRWN